MQDVGEASIAPRNFVGGLGFVLICFRRFGFPLPGGCVAIDVFRAFITISISSLADV